MPATPRWFPFSNPAYPLIIHSDTSDIYMKAALNTTILMRTLFPDKWHNVLRIDFTNFVARLLTVSLQEPLISRPHLNFITFHTLFLLHDLRLRNYEPPFGISDVYSLFMGAYLLTMSLFSATFDFKWDVWAYFTNHRFSRTRLLRIHRILIPKFLMDPLIPPERIAAFEVRFIELHSKSALHVLLGMAPTERDAGMYELCFQTIFRKEEFPFRYGMQFRHFINYVLHSTYDSLTCSPNQLFKPTCWLVRKIKENVFINPRLQQRNPLAYRDVYVIFLVSYKVSYQFFCAEPPLVSWVCLANMVDIWSLHRLDEIEASIPTDTRQQFMTIFLPSLTLR
ncbi:hypothetical protein M422DRAFT_783779 [Sphaerobolus stellatus SS14]|uniref:Unplaced genomic scaffold SPHSTscaffold_168, whole genome shotgun sequence n=1 Tax=Sphaerobolus stellatus (strain SS14) TaxID=990650 RepID=A0A0C9UA23_SPHS4|nr:hypothetical protein M422DRAFT_783779 [Sphaerobolus stellatus SS14]